MDRRAFITTLTGGLLAAPLAAGAQQPGATARVGFLNSGFASLAAPSGIFGPLYQALREGLRELGYMEGQNLLIESRFGEQNPSRLVKLAAELIAWKPDVIIAPGADSLKAVRDLSANTAVVTVDYEVDPVAAGYISSFARPGANITGVFLDQPELAGKWLQLLKDVIPKLVRTAALKDFAVAADQLKALEVAATSLAITLQTVLVRGLDDFANAFTAASNGRAQGLVILSSPMISRQGSRLAGLAGARRLPTISFFAEHARTGCLMAYGPSQVEIWRRLGSQAARILKGAHPADLPSERPAKFELVINLKTAKALGLTIPPSLLQRADEVIE